MNIKDNNTKKGVASPALTIPKDNREIHTVEKAAIESLTDSTSKKPFFKVMLAGKLGG